MKVLLNDGKIIEAGFDDPEGKKAFWHMSAHVLAQAVKLLSVAGRISAYVG